MTTLDMDMEDFVIIDVATQPFISYESIDVATQPSITYESIELKKVVIVVGGTGTGKSTIINMLYNDDFSATSCQKPCMVNYTADSVTKSAMWHFSPNGKVYGDTVGFNDPSCTDLKIALELKDFVSMCKQGVHCIIVVMKFGRVSRDERCNLQLISELFESRWVKSCILVLTHYEEGDECEETQMEHINKWLADDQELKHFVTKIKKNVIVTNNAVKPLYETVTRPLREKCLQQLRDFIDNCSILVGPAPLNLFEMIKRLIERLLDYTGIINAKKRIKNVMEFFKATPGQAGTCPICSEILEVSNMAQTECFHLFHIKCLEMHLEQTTKKCPMCRQDVRKVSILSREIAKN